MLAGLGALTISATALIACTKSDNDSPTGSQNGNSNDGVESKNNEGTFDTLKTKLKQKLTSLKSFYSHLSGLVTSVPGMDNKIDLTGIFTQLNSQIDQLTPQNIRMNNVAIKASLNAQKQSISVHTKTIGIHPQPDDFTSLQADIDEMINILDKMTAFAKP